jgi:anti-anti-sigma regulatory factor
MPAQIEVIRSGEWLPADELLANMLVVLEQSSDVCIDLAGADYLDGSSLQLLLGLIVHQKKRGTGLRLMHASAPLREWLDCAGASPYLMDTGSGNV